MPFTSPITTAPLMPVGPDPDGHLPAVLGPPTTYPGYAVPPQIQAYGNMGVGGYTPQQSAATSNLLRAALPPQAQQQVPSGLASLLNLPQQNALAQGLLGLGASLTAAGSPSSVPRTFMNAIGQGGQGFAQGYQNAQQANIANRLNAYKVAADMRQKPFAVGNRVYDPNTGAFISATGTGASAQPPTGVNYTPLEIEQYRALADDPEEQVKFVERINKVRDDAHRNFRTEIRPFATQLQEIDRKTSIVFAAVEKKNGTADIAAINAYQRLIDDGVVRSDDVKLQGSARSLRDSVVAQIENIKAGDLLPQSVRDNMADMTRVLLGQTLPGIEARITGVQEIVGMDERLDFNQVFAPSVRTFLERARKNTQPPSALLAGSPAAMPLTLGNT